MGSLKKKEPFQWEGTEDSLAVFARELIQFKSTRCFLLEGPMGAGKSTLAREIIRALGYQSYRGGSPTFPIWIPVEGGKVHHVDCYRLENEEELEARGLNEILWDTEAIVLIEWLSKFPKTYKKIAALPGSLEVQLGFIENSELTRKIEIRFP